LWKLNVQKNKNEYKKALADSFDAARTVYCVGYLK
jgi:hypothetical protein